VHAFGRVMDLATTRSGKATWVEKTPDHIFFVDPIERHLAPVRFIHLIRRGTDVVASLHEVTRRFPDRWHGAWNIDRCIEKWTGAASVSIGMAGRRTHHLVSFEVLLDEPDRILAGICEFLGVPYSTQMTERRSDATGAIMRDEPWKAMVRTEVSPPIARFERVFTKEQQDYVRARTESVQKALESALAREAVR
jgi:hypothetical protein